MAWRTTSWAGTARRDPPWDRLAVGEEVAFWLQIGEKTVEKHMENGVRLLMKLFRRGEIRGPIRRL